MEILAYWWVVATHNSTQMSNRPLSYLNSNPRGDFSQKEQTLVKSSLMLPFLRLPKVFHTVKGIKFLFEVSQYKNANFKTQFSHCLPWDYLRRTPDLFKTVVSQIPFGIFIMTYHCCSLMHIWKIRVSPHRNRPVIKIFQNRICSKMSPQLPPAISPRLFYSTRAETCPQPLFLNYGSSVPLGTET